MRPSDTGFFFPFICPHLTFLVQCSTCSQSFAKHHLLKQHEFEHTQVLPFICEYEECGKRFATASKLRNHAKSHVRIYRCIYEDCFHIVFTKWSDLRKVCLLIFCFFTDFFTIVHFLWVLIYL